MPIYGLVSIGCDTEMLEVRILPGEPKFFGFKQLQNLG